MFVRLRDPDGGSEDVQPGGSGAPGAVALEEGAAVLDVQEADEGKVLVMGVVTEPDVDAQCVHVGLEAGFQGILGDVPRQALDVQLHGCGGTGRWMASVFGEVLGYLWRWFVWDGTMFVV
ncbi:hypothetical protein IMZ48_46205 [Candidatus Bathyarchaeota archaeon]|nr:hypothetical protein [Candidatus Bathyarchaeota archaeon]